MIMDIKDFDCWPLSIHTCTYIFIGAQEIMEIKYKTLSCGVTGTSRQAQSQF